MIDLNLRVSGADSIGNLLGQLPVSLRARLLQAVSQSATELGQKARANAPEQSGNLRGSIHVAITESLRSVRGRVWSNWYIARFIEGGTNNPSVHVRAYARHVASGDRYATKRGRTRLTHVGVGTVSAYDRESHLAPHPFFHPAYDSMRGLIEQRVAAAIDGTLEAENG